MTDVSKAIYSGDWELYPCKGKITIQDFEHSKIVLTEAEALHVWRVLNAWVERNAIVLPIDSSIMVDSGLRFSKGVRSARPLSVPIPILSFQ